MIHECFVEAEKRPIQPQKTGKSLLKEEKIPMKSKKVGLKFGGYQKCVYLCTRLRDVAQLVAHASGGREVASSSLVIPT